ncbi:molybdopterin-dependent oxidoreductase [Azospirillum sp. TSO22-1]|uniref:molybdopterin-dependent oxidoreductase n=1 Tax=Azospirillum sp. TSO22-1 TaxID=716789 RepID=UPI0013048B7B|nr:molybdopterin-dependent oxidoreductase [Azospirillum sp. TSO22-1]
MRRAAACFLGLVFLLPMADTGQAGDLAAPTGEAILIVAGAIERTNDHGRAVFDRSMLTALGWAKLRTSTSWTQGVVEFEGIPLLAVMEAVGPRGETLIATALNDYKVKIPVSDARMYPVLLALRQNGRDLSIRDKGPIWIVYPRDAFPELQTETVNARWVWQLSRLDVQ